MVKMFKKGIFLGFVFFIVSIYELLNARGNTFFKSCLLILFLMIGMIQIGMSIRCDKLYKIRILTLCFILEAVYYLIAVFYLFAASAASEVKIIGSLAAVIMTGLILYSIYCLKNDSVGGQEGNPH